MFPRLFDILYKSTMVNWIYECLFKNSSCLNFDLQKLTFEVGMNWALVFYTSFFSFSFFYYFDFCKVVNDKTKVTLILFF